MSKLRKKERVIRKDDDVLVISGAYKGREGKVLAVDGKRQRVTVEGLNQIIKHVRKSQENPQGARLKREAPIHVSNLRKIVRRKTEEDSGEE